MKNEKKLEDKPITNVSNSYFATWLMQGAKFVGPYS